MVCLFCRRDSSNSRSIEHVIPESLGNQTLTLPPGVVCDQCNNYFSREVEKPFLASAAITALRFHEALPSKKGKIPPLDGVLLPGFPVRLFRAPSPDLRTSVAVPPAAFDHLLGSEKGKLILPASADPPTGPVVSRFMAKVALEAMALRLVDYPDGIEYLAQEAQLDPIRDHARRGDIRVWPVHVRRIYSQNAQWIDDKGASVQMLHESDILRTDSNEWYFVLALFGVELTINYGGPQIDGYLAWLADHGDQSPLYVGKNARATGVRPAG